MRCIIRYVRESPLPLLDVYGATALRPLSERAELTLHLYTPHTTPLFPTLSRKRERSFVGVTNQITGFSSLHAALLGGPVDVSDWFSEPADCIRSFELHL